ncbi:thiamine phosphate synthase [Candidatus Parcubacteria bacterium]|nr:thiamine phosphate synthase [Candidatus Parcubacteria bacterium]
MIKELSKTSFKAGFYLIVCPEITPNCVKIVQEAIKGGAEIVQLRAKEMADDKVFALAKRIRAITKETGVFFIINDRVDIALAADADGVHLGQDDLPIKAAKQLLEGKTIGISTHSLKEALKAQKEGADYIGLGPIFHTETKQGKALGIEMITRVKKAIKIPIVAIGGINKNNAEGILKAGADSIAVVSAVCNAKNVKKAAQELASLNRL